MRVPCTSIVSAAQLESFAADCRATFEVTALRIVPISRFARIEVRIEGEEFPQAFGFIDLSSGDVMAAASWSKVARDASGNLFKPLDASMGRDAIGSGGILPASATAFGTAALAVPVA
jgi:hypothetical protein